MHPRKTCPEMGGTIPCHPSYPRWNLHLSTMEGKTLPRTWHLLNLKKFYV
ncbi:hypothetical protein BHE74_00024787 [Ensete ventricosum]|uniref:Uncharacterized protein n=1 Tax=Ensete ventricosum TaxID=4639 RepID=A0A445MD67_ENSVE|nr:hypothetical protein BHE74_00024787 [Ensete ventricosum]RZR72149.1 hypothetical protein BHM03_00010859 [Ensete ventricosum]